MHKVALFVVVASVLLSGCNRRAEEVKDCSAGKAQPAMDVGQAMSVLKAAGYEVRRPDEAPSGSAAISPSVTASTAAPGAAPAQQPQAPEQAPAPVQTPALAQAAAPVHTTTPHRFSLLCNATIQGQPVSQSLAVDLDADTVNGVQAEVSDTEIRWTTQSHDQSGAAFNGETHTLNRLTGDYRFYDEAAIYSATAPTWQCALASKRVF
jgi:outer membrane murein-binding lipoprotein Lpp